MALFFVPTPSMHVVIHQNFFLNCVSRRVHRSSVCSLPRSTCSSWFCMVGISWTREVGTRTASRPMSTRLVPFLKQSCVFTTLLHWDAWPSAWYPALPSALRPSHWCPSKMTDIHSYPHTTACRMCC